MTLNTLKQWKPYPNYKPSGVDWLGDIPDGWDVKRLKYLVNVQGGYAFSSNDFTDSGSQLIKIANLYQNQLCLDRQPTFLPNDYLKLYPQFVVTKDDILMSLTGTLGKRDYGFAVLLKTNDKFLLNQRVAKISLSRQNLSSQDFILYLLQTELYLHQLFLQPSGTKQGNLSETHVTSPYIVYPPLPEQEKIAQFLDEETAKIDKLITLKQRLIELLREKRTALISHAVTKGLNPDVHKKDSGVEWLGLIPEHWDILLLKRIANIRYGLGQPPPEIIDGLPLIRATNVKSGQILEKDMIYIDVNQVPESRNAILSTGEIIVVRSGAYTGDSAIIPEKYNGSVAGYDMVTTVKKGNSEFIAWQLLSTEVRYIQFVFHQLRAAQPHLNAEELRGTIITFPPLQEQQKIAEYLDKKTEQIDQIINKTRESIEYLKEYRTALISAAVTGKIDVKGE